MSDTQRAAVFARFRRGEFETEAEKDLLLACHEHRLAPGTPAFKQAQELYLERLKRLQGVG